MSFAGGEVSNPARNLPRAIILGTVVIIVIYVVTNVAYLYVLPVDEVARSPLVAADVMQTLFGRVGVVAVSLVVMISTFSAVNGVTLSAPRIFFAMAEDGLLFSALGRVHPRFHDTVRRDRRLGPARNCTRDEPELRSAVEHDGARGVAVLRTDSRRAFRLRRRDLMRRDRIASPDIRFVPAIFIATVVWFVINALITDPISTTTTLAFDTRWRSVYFFSFTRAEFR